MDLKENIRKAAEVYQHQKCYVDKGIAEECIDCFIAGAKSQAAKDYWYNEFKREKPSPIIIDERSYFDTDIVIKLLKRKKELEFGTGGGPTDEENELLQKQVVEPGYEEQRQYQQYLKEHPDRPISFNNWKYMIEHYPTEPWIDCNELNASIDRVQGKRIGIIGHVDHGKSITGKIIIVGETGVDDRIVASAHNIQSIVPIADIIPDASIMHLNSTHGIDLHVEQILPPAWDTKKQKKENHKRNNKRRK